MAPWAHLLRVVIICENAIVNRILASPGWHRFVRGVHRRVEDYRYGRDPSEPLRQGEATQDPNLNSGGFLTHFINELRNQIRGTPTNPPKPGPPSQPKR